MNQELSNYVAQSRAAGVSDEEIKKRLLASGWQPGDVNREIGEHSRPERSKKIKIIFSILCGMLLTFTIVPGMLYEYSVDRCFEERCTKGSLCPPGTCGHGIGGNTVADYGIALLVSVAVSGLIWIFLTREFFRPTKMKLALALGLFSLGVLDFAGSLFPLLLSRFFWSINLLLLELHKDYVNFPDIGGSVSLWFGVFALGMYIYSCIIIRFLQFFRAQLNRTNQRSA